MIDLPIKTVLRNAREHLNELSIMKDEDSVCQYSAPCVVGMSIPPQDRERLDSSLYVQYPDVNYLEEVGEIKTDNIDDLSLLQNAHDQGNIDTFLTCLINLEIKHGLRAVDGATQ